jgi:hypothetical protein
MFFGAAAKKDSSALKEKEQEKPKAKPAVKEEEEEDAPIPPPKPNVSSAFLSIRLSIHLTRNFHREASNANPWLTSSNPRPKLRVQVKPGKQTITQHRGYPLEHPLWLLRNHLRQGLRPPLLRAHGEAPRAVRSAWIGKTMIPRLTKRRLASTKKRLRRGQMRKLNKLQLQPSCA